MIHLLKLAEPTTRVALALMFLTIPAASNVLETAHFSIDYELSGPHGIHLTNDTDRNDHPDYIDSLACFATAAWAIITDTLGFPAPEPLNESSRKFTIKVRDIYTWDTARVEELGYCTTTANGKSELLIENDFLWGACDCPSSDFFYIDTVWTTINNYINPFPKMKVTIFHELFHASQAVSLKNSPTSLRESAALWFQTRWTGHYPVPMCDACFKSIGKGWFSNDSVTKCGNFPFLLYAEETMGRGFVRKIHEYRSRHLPEVPGDPYAEARNFHNFCEENGYAEKELLKGFTEEIAAIIDKRDAEVLTKLGKVYKDHCLYQGDTIPGLDIRDEKKVAWTGEPFGMTVFKLPVGAWTFVAGSAIKMCVAGSEEWGYIVPVIEADSSRIVMPTVYFDRSHPLHLPLPKDSRRLALYMHHTCAGMKGEFELILPADYPLRKLKPVTVYTSESSPDKNFSAFDQNLETVWSGTSMTMDFGEILEIRQSVLYTSFATYPEMAVYLSHSADGETFTRETNKQCLGNIMIAPLFCSARYVRIECTGLNSLSGIQEFEVLSPRPPAIADRILPVVVKRPFSIGTNGNRLIINRQPNPEVVYRVFSLNGRIASGFMHASGKPDISKSLTSGMYIVRLHGKISGGSVGVVVP